MDASPPDRAAASGVRRTGVWTTARTLVHHPITRSDTGWILGVGILVLLMALLPLSLDAGFYYFDDTAGGAFGQWWELGQQLRAGHWPMLSLESWYAGNYLVEGQWGLYSPLVWAIAVASTTATDAAVFSAGVKIFFLVLGGLGVYLLARSLGVSPPFALLAGLSAPFTGFTLYLDATTWVTNLEVWALFPWAWWALRRYAYGHGSLVAAFAAGYLVITVGYVQGTLMLVLLHVALLVEQAVARQWASLGRSLLVGVTHALVTLTVFLPGLASADVSVRADTVTNDGFMTLTLNGLAVAVAPLARADLAGWWGRYAPMPYTYIAWFLPLVALIPGSRLRHVLARNLGVTVMMVLVLLLAVGPSQLGPLRFPIRSMPWVATTLILLTCAALNEVRSAIPLSRGRLAATAGLFAAAHWLAWAASPDFWKQQLGLGLFTASVAAGIWWVASAPAALVGRPWPLPAALAVRLRPVPIIAGTLVVVTLVLFGQQSRVFARHADEHFGIDGVPTDVAQLAEPLDEARGEVMVVGNPLSLGADLWEESTLGNLWHLKPQPTLNLYSPVGFGAFADDLCVQPYYGLSCYAGLATLFTPDDETDELLVDLLGLDTIQVLADPGDRAASVRALQRRFEVPDGWSLADVDDVSFTWVRNADTPPLGSPTWSTPGLEVTVASNTDEELRLEVVAAPAGGGSVVLSRLAWPGYTVEGATLGDPLRGYLLHVEVPADAVGRQVLVRFRPPLWGVQVASLSAALVLVGVGTLVAGLRRRRDPEPSAPAVS